MNKIFLRSGYGFISDTVIADLMEVTYPGLTAYIRQKCPADDSDPVGEIFPMEKFFGLILKSVDLDFEKCFSLIDLSVECLRQQSERKPIPPVISVALILAHEVYL